MKYYRDLKNSFDTAREEGWEEGHAEGIKEGIEKGKHLQTIELAQSLLKNDVSIDIISKSTGLSKNEIENIRNSK